ncbi:MAG TPA: hypothetical protein PKZ32_01735, partial [Candidatus Melainabacteria bacterium]|nr:hypothetical protein [Candidatus Melainabacteria bacterium]
GLLLIDGGLQANLPVKQAKELGGDIVIAVDVDEKFTQLSEKDFRRIGSVSKRVINMVLSKVDEDQLSAADLVIQPNVNNISLLSTKTKDARRAIEEGESAASKALPDIRARLDKISKLKLADQAPLSSDLKDQQEVKSAE